MVDQTFEAVLEGVAARHEDKSWRSVLNRASDGMMSAFGMGRGPKIAETRAHTQAARAAYEEFDDEGEEAIQPDAKQTARQNERVDPRRTASGEAQSRRAGSQPGPAMVAPSTDPRMIARELKLHTARSLAELKELRRSFARANHPDRVAIAFRTEANVRMQIANRLIDEAMARASVATR
ncbi:hypothetical protein [Jiella marina]|uniref:hypothetical protein n=1 Tax=Jiella sp. LLJ827 TaxID=2917712 RepID=UPI0021007706|nr:hypothetical protein [Jiella sp. LLJ827]MCQ0989128.1 hypothetical protein [Jiella sp. LLJ827]